MGRDGKERIKCFSCQFVEDAIGLAVLLGEKPFGSHRRWFTRPKKKREERLREARVIRQLEDDPTIEKDWILAKKLAELGNLRAVQVEVQRNWDYLSKNYNLPRAYELCQRIWSYGVERLGLTGEFKYWVERVAAELETA